MNYIEYNNLLEQIVEKARQAVWKSYLCERAKSICNNKCENCAWRVD